MIIGTSVTLLPFFVVLHHAVMIEAMAHRQSSTDA